MRYSIAFAGCLCAGFLTGCYNDPHFGFPQLFVPGSTPAEKTAYEQAESQRFDPYPDPNLSHSDGGMRPLGFNQPREPYPVRPLPAPIVVTPAPAGSMGAPYPYAGPSMAAPGSFPAGSPTPYPGATPDPALSPNFAPIPGPAPAPYELR